MVHQINAIGFKKFENMKVINERASKFWLYGLIFGVLGSLAKLRLNAQKSFVAAKGLKSTDATVRAQVSKDLKDIQT
jgi:peroxin-11B